MAFTTYFLFPHLTLMWDNFTAFCGTESTRGGAGGTWPSLRGLFTDTGSVVERFSSDESIPLSLSLPRYHPSSVKAHVKFWSNRRIILKVPLLKRKGWSRADRWREKAQSKSKLRKNESEETREEKKAKGWRRRWLPPRPSFSTPPLSLSTGRGSTRDLDKSQDFFDLRVWNYCIGPPLKSQQSLNAFILISKHALQIHIKLIDYSLTFIKSWMSGMVKSVKYLSYIFHPLTIGR